MVLVGRGATDPDANAEVAKTARLLLEGRGIGTVETAFISLAEPSVPAGAGAGAARLGYRRVVVLPYFLFAGVLPDRIVAQAAGWAAAHPDVDVRDRRADRAAASGSPRWSSSGGAELAGGDLRMNCDTCAYRVALPGFEDKRRRAADPARPPRRPRRTPTGTTHRHGPPALMDPLRHHGDAEVGPGLLDLAVNVRGAAPPRLAAARCSRQP